MPFESDVETLRHFNEAATKLNSRRFIESVRGGYSTYSLSWRRGEGTQITPQLPDAEDTESYLLTFRLFVQDNESFSLRNLSALYQRIPVTDGLRQQFEAIRRSVNGFLDALSPVIWHSQNLSRRHIFEVFLYGGSAHWNREKKSIYDQWMSDDIMKVILTSEFVFIVAALTQAIFNIRHVNIDALKALGADA